MVLRKDLKLDILLLQVIKVGLERLPFFKNMLWREEN